MRIHRNEKKLVYHYTHLIAGGTIIQDGYLRVSEFEKKQLERIKIFPQKRTPGIDSPTLREIANQNAKRLRVDGKTSVH